MIDDIKAASLTPQEILTQQLLSLIPDAFSEGKIDWERLRAILGEDINFSNERYVLNWAGKSDAFRVLQAPTTQTLVPAKGESISFDDTENIFIEGENLGVLKVLQKSYFRKIKMIYIDPPYNTGKDSFIYPDRFAESKEDYQKRVGDKDESGYMTREGLFRTNSKENGQYHSNWLNMMYPRLYLAKNLLSNNGAIFVSIDDNEVHNLRLLMNEIFGEENFIAQIIWKNATDNNPTQVAIEHEYLLVYSKNKNLLDSEWKNHVSDIKDKLIDIGKKLGEECGSLEELKQEYAKWFKDNKPYLWPLDRYKYIDFDGVYTGSQSVHNPGKEGYRYDVIHPETGKPCNQPLMGYRFTKDTMLDLLKEERILFGDDENKIVELKVYAHEYQEKLPSVIDLDGRLGSYDLKELFTEKRLFNNPKPVRFLNSFFPFVLKDTDTVLDFFSGSLTTAHAVLELNARDNGKRKFICVQLPEACDPKSEASKAGYATIADIGKERIRRIIKKIEDRTKGKIDFEDQKSDLGFKVFKLADSNFKQWQQVDIKDADSLGEQLEIFVNPISESATSDNMVYELLLKAGKKLNSKVEQKSGYCLVNNGELVLMLESVDKETIKSVLGHHPKKVIALDILFKDQDQLKTNTVLQMRDAGIEFKTL